MSRIGASLIEEFLKSLGELLLIFDANFTEYDGHY